MRSMWQRVLHDNSGKFNWMWGTDEIEEFFLGPEEKSRLEGYTIPDFQEDPDYRKSQDYLSELGIDILGGDIPDYYAGIGEAGGVEFENFLNLMTGDIKEAGLEAGAAIGRGGGGVTSTIAKNVGEFSTKARYADLLDSKEGKKWLFGQGRDITEGVRGAGQTQGNIANTYALNKSGKEMNLLEYLDKFDVSSAEARGEAESNMINMLISGGLTGVGVATANPALAAQGLSGFAGGFDWENILDEFDFGKDNLTGVAGKKKKAELGTINV